MKFYCKNCNSEFEREYEDLTGELKCSNCGYKDIMMNFVEQGIELPNTGFGISYMEFEDLLETGHKEYLERFFKDEFDFDFSRQDYDFQLLDQSGSAVNLEETYQKTQDNEKLRGIVYNIFYLLLNDF